MDNKADVVNMKRYDGDVWADIEKTFKYIPYLVICIAGISFIMIISNPFMWIEVDNDWIGFYGGLLGAIIGGFVTYKGVELSVNESNKQFKTNISELKQQQLDEGNAKREEDRKNQMPYIAAKVFSRNKTESLNAQVNGSVIIFHTKKTDSSKNIMNNDNWFVITFHNIGMNSCSCLSTELLVLREKPDGQLDVTEIFEIENGNNYLSKDHVTYSTKVYHHLEDEIFKIVHNFKDLFGRQYKQETLIKKISKDDNVFYTCEVTNPILQVSIT